MQALPSLAAGKPKKQGQQESGVEEETAGSASASVDDGSDSDFAVTSEGSE